MVSAVIPIRHRRRFSREFKRQLVDQCTPGVPFAGIALSHGISANLLRRRIGKFRIDVNLTGWYGQHIDRDTGSAVREPFPAMKSLPQDRIRGCSSSSRQRVAPTGLLREYNFSVGLT